MNITRYGMKAARTQEGGPLSGHGSPAVPVFVAPPALQSLRLFRYPPVGGICSRRRAAQAKAFAQRTPYCKVNRVRREK
jgi:hypothetical protein